MRALLIVVSVGLCGASLAQEVMPSGYVGVGIGTFDYDQNIDDLFDFSNSSDSYKIYGGYRFDDTWAFEASYGEPDTVTQAVSIPPAAGTIGLDIEVLTLRGIAHFNYFFVGAGYFDADALIFLDYTDPSGSFHLEDSASEDGLTAVLGLQWDFSSVSLRIEYEWFDVDDADASELGVGVHYRFK
jgi:opacity protein-like surface antigen